MRIGGSELVRDLAGAALDVLYPRTCTACGALDPEDGRHLCWDCLAAIRFIQPPYCSRCGDPVAGRVDHEYLCPACIRGPIFFDTARSAAHYESPLADSIRLLKYHKGLWAASDLAEMLFAALTAHFDPGLIEAVGFVPLFPARRRKREYNQSEVLARALCRRAGLSLLKNGLVRIRPTPTQTHLTASARADNVRDAFRARNPKWLKDRRILLVDDVMTTGATVNECARVLREAGAAKVWALTVARG
ncbi:MAG: ComF family protein [Kiritimatiellia bacterium]|nr:ComF family protein [Kiritimatiellia bacterium]